MKLIFASAAFLLAALPATAAVLPVNGGWQSDELTVAGEPTLNSDWTVTFTSTGKIWLLDCCISGDVWTITGDLAGVSSFYVGGPLHYALAPLAEWASSAHSKLEISGIAAGTYTFSLTGDGSGGVPAGVYLAATQVPEPAMWAMMIAGFGLVGYASRRRSWIAVN